MICRVLLLALNKTLGALAFTIECMSRENRLNIVENIKLGVKVFTNSKKKYQM